MSRILLCGKKPQYDGNRLLEAKLLSEIFFIAYVKSRFIYGRNGISTFIF
jgi:hypothetical protein